MGARLGGVKKHDHSRLGRSGDRQDCPSPSLSCCYRNERKFSNSRHRPLSCGITQKRFLYLQRDCFGRCSKKLFEIDSPCRTHPLFLADWPSAASSRNPYLPTAYRNAYSESPLGSDRRVQRRGPAATLCQVHGRWIKRVTVCGRWRRKHVESPLACCPHFCGGEYSAKKSCIIDRYIVPPPGGGE